MATVYFSHPNPQIGKLSIDNGIDSAEWGYGLNTANFPTYGGEVVQILSVYVDDVTFTGTISSYAQMEAIYQYFATYLLNATQSGSFDPYPVYFAYPERNWNFKIYPKTIPGFRYGREVVAPTWQIQCHVIDDSPDLDLIKSGLKALAVTQMNQNNINLDGGNNESAFTKLNGEISPDQGNPDTDPWETYTADLTHQTTVIGKYADYFNSLIPSYEQGQFDALTAGAGSQPAMPNAGTGGTNTSNSNTSTTTQAPKPPKQKASPPPFRQPVH